MQTVVSEFWHIFRRDGCVSAILRERMVVTYGFLEVIHLLVLLYLSLSLCIVNSHSMAAVVAATSVAVIRLNEDEEQEANTMAEEFADSQLDGEETAGAEDDYANRWAFLIGYFLELTMALFVFYPLTSTMFFSGILGCGRLPVIGGRPYEMWKARLKAERKKNKNGEETSENEEDFDEEDVGAMMFYEC